MRKLALFFISLFVAINLIAQTDTEAHSALEKPLYPVMDFAPEGGFYSGEQIVEIFSPDAEIYYTTDGSMPRRNEINLYEGPILVDVNMVIRAIAYRDGVFSHPISHTYFLNEEKSTFPTISLSVTPSLLFDVEKGLFVEGKNVSDNFWKKTRANFWSRKEIAINTEFYEPDSICAFRSQTGLRLFGGMSRLFPQKSMTLVTRSRYGNKRIKHNVFGEEGLNKYKFLVLRNSGSDFGKSHFRDAFMTGLLKDWDLETQLYRPSNVYINGKYWGIYNIREKVNRYFINGRFDLDKDSVDIMEHRLTTKRGSSKHYVRTLKYMLDNSLADPRHYAYINSRIEVENFMDYQIAQIYFDNQDAGGNIKYWRPQTEDGKWRWILYDTDWGFGLHDKTAYKNNSLEFHTKPDGEAWPNPAWSTFILRKLLENSEFKRAFINRFADRLNTSFQEANVSAQLDTYVKKLEPEIARHLKRWRLKESKWISHIQTMKTFGEKRPYYMRQHLQDKFDLGEMNNLSLSTTSGGKIVLNDNIKVKSDKKFRGIYFSNVPVHVEAKPRLGYRFVGWEGIDYEEREIVLQLDAKYTKLHAKFEKYDHPLAGKIIINEVNCNNKKAGDWVEIYNYSDENINLKDWIFTDSKNKFKIPEITLPARDYLILAEHKDRFGQTYPEAYRFIGDLGFGLSKRSEDLALFDNTGAWVDSIAYTLIPTDSVFTLNLLLPNLNNSDPENWEAVNGWGTPCAANPYYIASTLQAKQELWMQIGGAIGVIILCVLLLFFRNRGSL